MDLNNISAGTLLGGLIFSGLGIFYFRLGRKEGNLKLVAIAMALIIYSYFVGNPYLCWAIGIGLTVLAHKTLNS